MSGNALELFDRNGAPVYVGGVFGCDGIFPPDEQHIKPSLSGAPRQRPSRRVLAPVDDLGGPREPSAFLEAALAAYVAAQSCERRSRHYAKSITATEDERARYRDSMDEALARMGRIQAAILRRLR